MNATRSGDHFAQKHFEDARPVRAILLTLRAFRFFDPDVSVILLADLAPLIRGRCYWRVNLRVSLWYQPLFRYWPAGQLDPAAPASGKDFIDDQYGE